MAAKSAIKPSPPCAGRSASCSRTSSCSPAGSTRQPPKDGQRDVKLWGGQKQLLAIARVFLKNPPILILDEATSALDTATEREIQTALADLAAGPTPPSPAPRVATIRHADRIVVVTEGGIAEEGRHDALLAAGGYYHVL